MSLVQLGRALGYSGNPNTISVTIRRYESGKREIPPDVEQRARMIARNGLSS